MEIVCRRRMRRPATPKTLGVFPGLPKWKKATEGFFRGQLAEHIAPATAAGWLVTLKLIETTAEPQHLFSQQAKFLPN